MSFFEESIKSTYSDNKNTSSTLIAYIANEMNLLPFIDIGRIYQYVFDKPELLSKTVSPSYNIMWWFFFHCYSFDYLRNGSFSISDIILTSSFVLFFTRVRISCELSKIEIGTSVFWDQQIFNYFKNYDVKI